MRQQDEIKAVQDEIKVAPDSIMRATDAVSKPHQYPLVLHPLKTSHLHHHNLPLRPFKKQ